MNVLIDFKSRDKTYPSLEYMLQLGGYSLLLRRGHYFDENAKPIKPAATPELAVLLETSKSRTKVVQVLDKDQLSLAESAFEDLAIAFESCSKFDHRFRENSGRYIHPVTQEAYISVTEITQHMLAKKALMKWFYDMGVKGEDPWAYRDKRANIGSLIHGHLQSIIEGKDLSLDTFPDELKNALTHFKIWNKVAQLDPEIMEKKMYVTLGHIKFAGRTDFYGQANKEAFDA